MITKSLSFPVYLTPCYAISSDHLPFLRPSFHHPPDRPDFRRTDFQTRLEELIPFRPELHNEMAFGTCVEMFSVVVLKALAPSTPKRRPRDDPRRPIPASILDEIA